jgi:hypothetical protein
MNHNIIYNIVCLTGTLLRSAPVTCTLDSKLHCPFFLKFFLVFSKIHDNVEKFTLISKQGGGESGVRVVDVRVSEGGVIAGGGRG